MTQEQALQLAREHLYHACTLSVEPIEHYALARTLQYHLCTAHPRLERTLGEVTRRDVVLLVEAFLRDRPETGLEYCPWLG